MGGGKGLVCTSGDPFPTGIPRADGTVGEARHKSQIPASLQLQGGPGGP